MLLSAIIHWNRPEASWIQIGLTRFSRNSLEVQEGRSIKGHNDGVDRPVSLQKRTFEGLAQFLVTLGALLFLSAWSLSYWQAWLFWVVFSSAVTLVTVYFLKRDPALIERRLKAGPGAETEKSQKIIQSFAKIFFVALIIFPGIDHRFGWSHLSVQMVLAGDALVMLGLFVVFLVFRENSYASATIEVGKEQHVISTGPYRLVRHPMYAGGLLLVFGAPLGLGSVWGLLFCIPMVAVIVWRLIDEEKYLSKNLVGYIEYCARTRCRLMPWIY
jgi:protein-S-isoprenylcysteine O-methyltransferase Ste14